MRTVEEWLDFIYQRFSESRGVHHVKRTQQSADVLREVIPLIQAEAREDVLTPPGDLKLGEMDIQWYETALKDFFKSPNGRKLVNDGTAGCMIENLLHDLKTLRKVAHDVAASGDHEALTAMLDSARGEGYAAGLKYGEERVREEIRDDSRRLMAEAAARAAEDRQARIVRLINDAVTNRWDIPLGHLSPTSSPQEKP